MKNGYGFKNYLLDSGSKAVSRCCWGAVGVASLGQGIFWVNSLVLFPGAGMDGIALMMVCSFVLWLCSWWLCFDRMVTYIHWLAWFEHYEIENVTVNEIVEENVIRNYVQSGKQTKLEGV